MKSTIVDPWRTISGELSDNDTDESEIMSSLHFEDSFVSETHLASNADSSSLLPDSAEYLASLENKLAKLKSKRKGKDMVKSLEEKHKSCMVNLLSSDSHYVLDDDDFIMDTPVNNSHPLMRYVAPDKQALTVGELVELLKADHLSQVLEQQNQDDECNMHD